MEDLKSAELGVQTVHSTQRTDGELVTRYWVWENTHGRDWICDPQIQCLGEVTLGTEDM